MTNQSNYHIAAFQKSKPALKLVLGYRFYVWLN